MKIIFAAVSALILGGSAAAGQGLSVDVASSQSWLVKTFPERCKVNDKDGLVNCVYRYGSNTFTVAAGPGKVVLAPQYELYPISAVVITIRPQTAVNDPDVKRQFSEFAKQWKLPSGGMLADKYPTPQKLIDFCRNNPSSQNDDEKNCNYSDIKWPGVKRGMITFLDGESNPNVFSVIVGTLTK